MLESTTLLLLAQESPPAPDEGTPLTGDANSGATGGAPPPAGGGQFSSVFVIMIVVLGGMILFSIFGQRRERKKREAMISAVKKGDQVQTIGGVMGSVVELKGDQVVLKVDESSNTRITFARSSVQQVVDQKGAPESALAQPEA
jgi:preprotein translocase subunit YajC